MVPADGEREVPHLHCWHGARRTPAVYTRQPLDYNRQCLAEGVGNLVGGPYARFIPKSALAGLLFITAVRLIDWHRLAYEHLERFLRDAHELGVTVLLAGVRPDFVKILRNVGINKWFPTEHIFPEEDRTFSATLRAVRYANRLVSHSGASKGANEADTRTAPEQAEEAVYYLV